MFELFDNFHFIRPLWFYALIPAVLLFIWLFLKKQQSVNWSKICDQELLDYFLVQNGKAASRYPVILVLLAWLLSVFSLAGPSWEKTNAPIYSNQDALVIILDLSLSMNASDIQPSRIERAKHKLTDILQQRREGQTALLVYAGDAHIVSPLTPDNKTILSFIPVLNSSLMPIQGSNLNNALNKAEGLFKNAGIAKGEILLLSDGIKSGQQEQIQETIKKLKNAGYFLSVIGIGTQDGAPIPDQNSGFIKDQQGNIVLSKLNNQQLQQLANTGGGSYHRMTISDQDIQAILTKRKNSFQQNTGDDSAKIKKDSQQQWLDQGALFALLILPLALLLFRKGWLLSFLIVLLPYPYQPAYSMQWNDLWLRANQQASESFASGQHEKAAELYTDSQWKGSSFYKAKIYQQAIEQFSKENTTEAKYNTANSLAQLKRLDEALKAYNEVLEKDPNHKDSLKNKKIVQDLIEKQKKNKQQQKDNKNSDKNKDNSSDKNKDNKQDKDQQKQNSEQKKSDKDQQDSKDQSEQQQNDQQSQQQKDAQDKEEQKKAEQEALKKQKEKQEKENKEQEKQNKALDDQEKQKEEQNKPDDEKPDDSLFSQLSDEEQQSMDQYLQQIKDDPAYLLRRKFYLNSTRSKQQNPNNTSQAQQPW